jgi:hypothetical protein
MTWFFLCIDHQLYKKLKKMHLFVYVKKVKLDKIHKIF